VLGGDVANVRLSTNGYTASFASAGVANGIGVTVSGLTLTGASATNYTLTQPAGLTANITAAGVNITSGISANNKTYDGTAVATISSNNVVLNGVMAGDTANVRLSTNGYTASFASAGASNGIVVTVGGLTLTGASATNYTLTQPAGLTANITAAGVNITSGISANSKTYDGTAVATISSNNVVLNGVVAGDTANVRLSTNGYTASFASAGASNGIVVTVGGLTLTGASVTNYTFTQPTGLTASITPATLMVSAVNKSRIYGLTNPPLTASYSGFVGSEGTNVLAGAPSLSTSAATNSLPGTYAIVAGAGTLSATNYIFAFVNGTLTVQPIHNGPSLLNQASQTNNELTSLVVINSAVDNDVPQLPLSYSLVVTTVTNMVGNSAVTNAAIDTNGIITWTPNEAQGPGVYTFNTVVSDGSLSATNNFTVVVNEVNTAPVLPPQFNRTIRGRQLVVVTNTATDSDIPANPLTYILLVKPTGATIDTNGVISWAVGNNQVPSTNTFTTVVTDTNAWAVNAKSLSTTNSFTAVVTSGAVNTPPWLPPQTNRVVNEQTTLVVTNTGMDSNIPADALTYALLTPPAGAVIDTNGVITWTPTEAQGPSTNTITTVVTDNGSPPMSATNSFTVIVNEVNTAPVLPGQSTKTIAVLATLTMTNTATDSDIPVNTLTYVLTTAPAGATISTNGVITWTPSTAPSTNTITTMVTDFNPWAVNAQHLSATNSFTVIVTVGSTNPMIQSISLTNGIVTIKWSALSGQSYRLQYKGTLTDSVWSDATPDFTATGFLATGTNGVNNSTQRFYRIKLLP
jgi:hypothetical protein